MALPTADRSASVPASSRRDRQPVASSGAPDSRTRILDAALHAFRAGGYAATTVDDLCRAAGVTKGSFFHHFDTKETAGLAAIDRWNAVTGAHFAAAAFWQQPDPRQRLLEYLDLRVSMAGGDLAEFTCLLGTLVQETFASHPTLRAACGAGIEVHARTLVPTIEAARQRHAPRASWSAEGLALHLQAVLQGAFVLAKSRNDPSLVADAVAHLRRYVEHILPPTPKRRPRA